MASPSWPLTFYITNTKQRSEVNCEVLTAVSMKTAAIYGVMQYSLVLGRNVLPPSSGRIRLWSSDVTDATLTDSIQQNSSWEASSSQAQPRTAHTPTIDLLSSSRSLCTATQTATTRPRLRAPCATHALHHGTTPSCLYNALTFGLLLFYYIPLFFLSRPGVHFHFPFYFAFYFSFIISFSLLFPLARSVCVYEYRPSLRRVYARTYVCIWCLCGRASPIQ